MSGVEILRQFGQYLAVEFGCLIEVAVPLESYRTRQQGVARVDRCGGLRRLIAHRAQRSCQSSGRMDQESSNKAPGESSPAALLSSGILCCSVSQAPIS